MASVVNSFISPSDLKHTNSSNSFAKVWENNINLSFHNFNSPNAMFSYANIVLNDSFMLILVAIALKYVYTLGDNSFIPEAAVSLSSPDTYKHNSIAKQYVNRYVTESCYSCLV